MEIFNPPLLGEFPWHLAKINVTHLTLSYPFSCLLTPLHVWFYRNCHDSVLFEMFWFLANSWLTPSPIPFEWTPSGGKVLPEGESLMKLSHEPRFLTSWEKLESWLALAWPPAVAAPAGPWTPRQYRWCHDSPRSSLSAEDLAHCMCLGHKDKLLPGTNKIKEK